MAKKNKTDYLGEIKKTAELSGTNLKEFSEKISNGSLFSYSPSYNGREQLLIIEQDLKKDYFTLIEREDIFMLAILGNEMYDATENLLRTASDIVITDFSREISEIADILIGGIQNLSDIISAFSKFPKTGDLTVFFKKHSETYDKFDEKMNALVKNTAYTAFFSFYIITEHLNKCMDCCKNIINYMRFAAIKNS